MTCDDALTHALARGPRPAEVEEHLRCCERCASELDALRRLEASLASAAPHHAATASLETAVLSRVVRPRQMGRAWLSAAAALLLAFALATAWFGRSMRPEVPAAAPALSDAAVGVLEEDSTAALLQAYEPYAADLPQVQPEEVSGYLAPTDQGGWNG